ncbi:MAG: hypothetical protein WAK55_10940 [Xanthobacteraceae bacterium]
MFFGDERDSKAPPSALQNVTQEVFRCGAKALRARLSVLSYQQVLQESMAALEHKKHAEAQGLAAIGEFERAKREERIRRLAPAMATKRNVSQSIDDAVAELAGPHLKKHPTWTSHRCAVEIEPRLNEALRAEGRRPLAQDAIRKRVQKYRTHAR